jgi:SAM-dependent methyltransferase
VTTARRTRISYQMAYALRHPGRVVPHLRRVARDRRLRKASGNDHVAYYRAVMADDASRNPEAAVGSARHDRWLALGKMQYDYLVGHGLCPEHHMLEIGCGNLRAGWRFVEHLDAGNYYGIDISPDILLDALRVIAERGLAPKLPNLTLVRDLRFGFLPDEQFDVVHAHSVFSHSPLNVIDECLGHVGRILRPNGWFDFTFDRTDGEEHHVLHEDFYYRTETLVKLAESHELHAEFMSDWEQLPHKQSKIRVRRT